MSEYLPTGDFKCINKSLEEILNTDDYAENGYFVEVHLKYPNEIKHKTRNFCLAPENKKVDENKFTEYMNEIKPKDYRPTTKLILDYSDKKKYLVHYRLLKFYVKMGMIVEKVHKVIQFKQSAWLKPYIEHNTNERKKAKTDFDKD